MDIQHHTNVPHDPNYYKTVWHAFSKVCVEGQSNNKNLLEIREVTVVVIILQQRWGLYLQCSQDINEGNSLYSLLLGKYVIEFKEFSLIRLN